MAGRRADPGGRNRRAQPGYADPVAQTVRHRLKPDDRCQPAPVPAVAPHRRPGAPRRLRTAAATGGVRYRAGHRPVGSMASSVVYARRRLRGGAARPVVRRGPVVRQRKRRSTRRARAYRLSHARRTRSRACSRSRSRAAISGPGRSGRKSPRSTVDCNFIMEARSTDREAQHWHRQSNGP